jgi:hypothetical protein
MAAHAGLDSGGGAGRAIGVLELAASLQAWAPSELISRHVDKWHEQSTLTTDPKPVDAEKIQSFICKSGGALCQL